MNTISKFLYDVTNIFSSVPETGKLIVRAITAKGALNFKYAHPVTISISNKQFRRRAAVARRGDRVPITVLHDLQLIS